MICNENILKLTGKVNLPQSLELGKNYDVRIEGSITSVSDMDRNDGTFDRMFKFEPVIVKVIDEMGVTIKAKDPRSESKKTRSMLYKFYESDNSQVIDFEEYYTKFQKQVRLEMDEIISRI